MTEKSNLPDETFYSAAARDCSDESQPRITQSSSNGQKYFSPALKSNSAVTDKVSVQDDLLLDDQEPQKQAPHNEPSAGANRANKEKHPWHLQS
jgi:hypothetical protein